MPKSRKRKKLTPPTPPRKGWWMRNRRGVYEGVGGGLLGGCLPMIAVGVLATVVSSR